MGSIGRSLAPDGHTARSIELRIAIVVTKMQYRFATGKSLVLVAKRRRNGLRANGANQTIAHTSSAGIPCCVILTANGFDQPAIVSYSARAGRTGPAWIRHYARCCRAYQGQADAESWYAVWLHQAASGRR